MIRPTTSALPAAQLLRLSRTQLPRAAARPTLALNPIARQASTQPSYHPNLERPPKKGIKIGYLFSGLALLGIGATSYGLWQFYSSFTAYPKEVRDHLRAALRSAATGSFPRADSSFATAYDQASQLAAAGQLGTPAQALQRTTGIVSKWGGMWEQAGQFERAAEVYQVGWEEIREAMKGRDVGEDGVMRGAALAMKLGDCWVRLGRARDQEAEKAYSWAVQEMMRLGMSDNQKERVRVELETGKAETTKEAEANKDDPEFDLPKWDGKTELVAGFERLAELYARMGKIEYALPLYQQAIATLLPPPPKDGSKGVPPPIATRCHASTLMNNLSSALVADPSPNAAQIDQASRWARQALLVANQCRKEADQARKGAVVPLAEREEGECEAVAVVGTYNLGKLAELAGEPESARQWLEKSLTHSKRIGSREGVAQSAEALRLLKTPAK